MTAIAPWMQRLGMLHPIIQAPMAGTSTPELAAAVSHAGGLGSLGLGAHSVEQAHANILRTRELTRAPFNVNLFCHRNAHADPERDAAWLEYLAPEFARFGARPPRRLENIYPSAVGNGPLQGMILQLRPAVVSFHFGLPEQPFIDALRRAGCLTMACATSLDEALHIEQAGIDVVIAQGMEAGGHRGVFEPEHDQFMGTLGLVQLLVRHTQLPVVAAGGIMDGTGIAAALQLGACGVQMGTAFVLCPESAASPAYRAALQSPRSMHTQLTSAISGRPARGLSSRLHALGQRYGQALPDYPRAYDAAKALHRVASASDCHDYAPFWAGQGAPLARALPAAELMHTLCQELYAAQKNSAR